MEDTPSGPASSGPERPTDRHHGDASFGWTLRGGGRRYASYVGNVPLRRRSFLLRLWQAVSMHRHLWFDGRFWLLVLAAAAAIAAIVGALGGPWWLPLLALPLLALVVERTSGLLTADSRASTRAALLWVLAPARASADETARTEAMLTASPLRMLELEGWSGEIVRSGWGAHGDRVDSASIIHLCGQPDSDDPAKRWAEGVTVEVAELDPRAGCDDTERMRDLAFELGGDPPSEEPPPEEPFEVPLAAVDLRVDGVTLPALGLRIGEAEGVRAVVDGLQVTVRGQRALPHPLVLRTGLRIVDYPEQPPAA